MGFRFLLSPFFSLAVELWGWGSGLVFFDCGTVNLFTDNFLPFCVYIPSFISFSLSHD